MFTLFFRAMILYAVMVAAMRIMGRRQLGEFQPYEFALTILLADLISSPMESVSTPLLHGLVPMAALVAVHGTITVLSLRSDRVRAFISGKPVVVISKGVIDRAALDRLALSLSELLEGLREAGILDPAEVGTAVFEANGKITAFPSADKRPPTTRELGIETDDEGLPLALVMDGRIQAHNLSRCGRDAAWLESCLARLEIDPKEIYLATLDTGGKLRVQTHNGELLALQAIDKEEVSW